MPFVSNIYTTILFVSCHVKIPAGTIPLPKTLPSSHFYFKQINSSDVQHPVPSQNFNKSKETIENIRARHGI